MRCFKPQNPNKDFIYLNAEHWNLRCRLSETLKSRAIRAKQQLFTHSQALVDKHSVLTNSNSSKLELHENSSNRTTKLLFHDLNRDAGFDRIRALSASTRPAQKKPSKSFLEENATNNIRIDPELQSTHIQRYNYKHTGISNPWIAIAPKPSCIHSKIFQTPLRNASASTNSEPPKIKFE